MAIKYYRLYCEICGHTIVTDGSNLKLVEYKRSKIQKELPKLNPTTNKTVAGTWLDLPKKYKCPKCGRLISARPFKGSESEDTTKDDNDKNFNTGSQGGFERF